MQQLRPLQTYRPALRQVAFWLLLAILFLPLRSARADSGVWNADSGQWQVDGNWSGVSYPQTATETATFAGAGPGPRLVTVDGAPVTIGALVFDSGHPYTIEATGGGSLTFGGGSGSLGQIIVASTNSVGQTISAPLSLERNLTITSESPAPLIISGPIVQSGANRSLTKNGAGEVVLSGSNSYSGTTTVAGGTLTLAGDGAVGNSQLALSGGALAATGGPRLLGNTISVLNNNFVFTGTASLGFSATWSLPGSRGIVVNNTLNFARINDPTGSGRNLRMRGTGELNINLTSPGNNIGAFLRNEGPGRLNVYGAGNNGALVYNCETGGGLVAIGDQYQLADGSVTRGVGELNIRGNGDAVRFDDPDVVFDVDLSATGNDLLVLADTTQNQNKNIQLQYNNNPNDSCPDTNPPGAELRVNLLNGFDPDPGDGFTIMRIDATGSGAINGTFNERPDGAVFAVGDQRYLIDYSAKSVLITRTLALNFLVDGGNNQSTVVDTPFADELAVLVTDQNGTPVPNVLVVFSGPVSGAGLNLSGGDRALSGPDGVARLTVRANTIAGSYNVTARTYPENLAATSFSLTNLPAGPAALTILGGDQQQAEVGSAFAVPLQVEVRDAYNNPVPGVTINFNPPDQGASALFPGGNQVSSDAAGRASVNAEANQLAGSYSVTASVVVSPTVSANFSLTNLALPAATPTDTATPTATPTDTATPTATPTATATPEADGPRIYYLPRIDR